MRAKYDQVLYEKLGGVIKQDNSSNCVSSINQTKEDQVQKDAAHFKLCMNLVSCSLAIFSLPLWGALSDQKGRHVALVAASIGAMVRAGSLLAVSLSSLVPLWVLIVAEALHTMLGKSTCTVFMACSAYTADVTPDGSRAVIMVIMDAIFYICVATAEYLSGVWITASGFTPFFTATISLQGALFLYSVLVFSKVTKPAAEESHQSSLMTEVKSYFFKSFRAFSQPRPGCVRACLLLMLCVGFFQSLALYGVMTVLTLYTLGPPLCWSSEMIGT